MNKNLSLWKYFYEYKEIFDAIQADFHFNLDREQSAAVLLSSILTSGQDRTIENLFLYLESIEAKHIVPIFITVSTQFQDHIQNLNKIMQNSQYLPLIIAADGTGPALIDSGVRPDFVFSDLDGITPQQLSGLTQNGTYVVVHAHGDNIPKIREFSDVLKKNTKVIGTTQTEITEVLINPGGFTDGDRSLFFFHHLLPTNIPFYLLGYNFKSVFISDNKRPLIPQGRETEYMENKLRKLKWAEKSIRWLTEHTKRGIYFDVLPQ